MSLELSYIEPSKIELYLCKPDKTIIGKLSEAYDINFSAKAYHINDLEFKIPFKLEATNETQLIDNLHIEETRYRYIIKMELNSYIEYFRIVVPEMASADNEDYKHISCLSLATELVDREISHYKAIAFNLNEIFNGKESTAGILSNTNWTVNGSECTFFTSKYRGVEVGGASTLYDVITNMLTEIFDIVVIFDTVNRVVRLWDEDAIGKTIEHDVLRVSYTKYLKTLNLAEDDTDFTTRLHVEGRDGLTLHTVMPTGRSYIEDFDYFLEGYVAGVSSSPYWSDALCAAQLSYQAAIISATAGYISLIDQRNTLVAQKYALETIAWELGTELLMIQDRLKVLQNIEKAYYDLEHQYHGTPEDIVCPLNPRWHYFVFGMIQSSDVTITINGYTQTMTPGEWEQLAKIYDMDEVTIGFSGVGGDVQVHFYICRVREQEFDADGITEQHVIWLGNASGGTWKLGNGAGWTSDLSYSASGEAVQTALRSLYSNTDITAEKEGLLGTQNVYYVIVFPVNLGSDSYLQTDFSNLIADDPFTNQEQYNADLLDAYSEHKAQAAYDTAMANVAAKQAEIDAVDASITAVWDSLELSNNFSSALLEERNNFVIEKHYVHPYIMDAPTLWIEAAHELEKINEPILVLNLDLVNFMEIVETSYDREKLFYTILQSGLYDTIVVSHEGMGIDVQCSIVDINYNFEEGSIGFVVSNVKEVLSDQEKLLKDMSYVKAAADAVIKDKPWQEGIDILNDLGSMANHDEVERAKLGNTLLPGGFLSGKLIDASSIFTGFFSGELIEEESITADKLAAGAITAEKINVDDLSAISATFTELRAGNDFNYMQFYIDTEGTFPKPTLDFVQYGATRLRLDDSIKFYSEAGNEVGYLRGEGFLGQGRVILQSDAWVKLISVTDDLDHYSSVDIENWSIHPSVTMMTSNTYSGVPRVAYLTVSDNIELYTDTGYIVGTGDLYINGDLTVTGLKHVMIETESYGKRLMYALETPSNKFCDIIEVEIKEGENWIDIEPMFSETMSSYIVFPSVQGKGIVNIIEQEKDKFKVVLKGNNKVKCSFLIYGNQIGKENIYMEKMKIKRDK